MEEKPISDWVERSNGRRESDQHKCAMHDYVMEKNDSCLNIIKQSIKDEVARRDHKFEVLEERLQQYISKWALGLIVSICITLVSALVGFAIWEIKTMHSQLEKISKNVSKSSDEFGEDFTGLKVSIAEMGITQKGILRELEKLAPEHLQLMEHLREVENQ